MRASLFWMLRLTCASAFASASAMSYSSENDFETRTYETLFSPSVIYISEAVSSPVTSTPLPVTSLLFMNTAVCTEAILPISSFVSGTTLSAVSCILFVWCDISR